MTGIVEFLTARLDEDEAAARLATAGPWSYDPSKQWQDPGDGQFQGQECVTYGKPPRANTPAAFGPPLASGGCVATTGPADDLPSMADAAHIARHDPARVLREVAAKRRIVELHTTGVIRTYKCSNGDHIQEWQCKRAQEPYTEDRYCEICGNECVELPVLAAVYADHPDYDPAWRVL